MKLIIIQKYVRVTEIIINFSPEKPRGLALKEFSQTRVYRAVEISAQFSR